MPYPDDIFDSDQNTTLPPAPPKTKKVPWVTTGGQSPSGQSPVDTSQTASVNPSGSNIDVGYSTPGPVGNQLTDLSQGIPSAPKSTAVQAYERVLQAQSPDNPTGMPSRPHPKIWQRILAGGLGAAAGIVNSDRLYQGQPLDPRAGEQAVLGTTGYNRDLQDWEVKAGAAKAAVADERQHDEDLMNARLKEAQIAESYDYRKLTASQRSLYDQERIQNQQTNIAAQVQGRDETAEQRFRTGGGALVPNVSTTPSTFPGPPPSQLPAGASPVDQLPPSTLPPVPQSLPAYVPEGSVPISSPPFVKRQYPGQDMSAYQEIPNQKAIDRGQMVAATPDQAKVLNIDPGTMIPTSQANTVQVGLRPKAAGAGAAKADAMAVMQKVATANPGVDMSDNAKIAAAIAKSNLDSDERAKLEGYIAMNSTPASTMSAGVARGYILRSLMPVDVLDSQTGNLGKITAGDLAKNEFLPGTNIPRYVPASEGDKQLQRNALFNEMYNSIDLAKGSLAKVTDTPQLRAAMAFVSDPIHADPSMIRNYADALTKTAAFTDSTGQLNANGRYFQNVAALRESVLSLRSLGMMGQGSESQRQALLSTVPGAQFVNVPFHEGQLDRARILVDQLHTGQPGIGGPTGLIPRGPSSSPSNPAGSPLTPADAQKYLMQVGWKKGPPTAAQKKAAEALATKDGKVLP